MRVTALTIENFRNLASVRLQPGPALNLLHGDNGAGKTSVLESLLVLAKGRSFRSGGIAPLIGPNEAWLRVVVDIQDGEGASHRVGVERERSEWRGRVDGQPLQQLSDAAGFFPIVLMEPTSHQLVSGAPDGRRKYLDWAVFHVKPGFLDAWRRYSRALKQRNAALRTGDRALVQSLDPQLVGLGMIIHEQRVAVTERLARVVASYVEAMSPELGALTLDYVAGWKEGSLAEALESGMERDLEQGLTSRGPHRADLSLRVGERAVRDRLSRGEQKLLAAAMLLAQAELFADDGRSPVLLLDDLASEFDHEHLERVVNAGLALGAQLFITGVEQGPYAFVETGQALMFHVKHGVVGEGSMPSAGA